MYCRFFSLISPASCRFLLTIFFLMIIVSPGKTADKNTDFFLHGDFVHKNNIKTVLFSQKDFVLSDPLIRLNSGDKLMLRFDDLDADYKNYYYTIVHCNAYWEPSELNQYEYIEGFYEDQIRDYQRSVNTRVSYTHYWLEFPNSNLRPSKSGNYILKVFLNGNPDDVVFTRRFSVFEQQVNINGHVEQARIVQHRDTRQQLSFTVNTEGYRIPNPYRELKLVITQNGRWDNAITGLEPRTIQGNQLIYDQNTEILFHGGNEFRHFDIRSLRYLSGQVQDIQSNRRNWDVYLMPDEPRTFERHVTDQGLKGRFQVITRDARNDMFESDYAWVHFHLPMDSPLPEGFLYVMGQLTDWQFTEENKMNYNYGENAYELSLLLKQGYYNYLYAYLPEEDATADLARIEGNHSVTENDYTIYVYHRQPGDLYDRLIGVSHMSSSTPR